MKETRVAVPFIGLIAGTRVALGVGVGLLVAKNLSAETRRKAGWLLVAVGTLSTIPLAMKVASGIMKPADYSI